MSRFKNPQAQRDAYAKMSIPELQAERSAAEAAIRQSRGGFTELSWFQDCERAIKAARIRDAKEAADAEAARAAALKTAADHRWQTLSRSSSLTADERETLKALREQYAPDSYVFPKTPAPAAAT